MSETMYTNALSRIGSLPKGEERKKLLQDDAFRSLLLSSGANVTLYSGEVMNAENKSASLEQALSGVYVGLIQRRNRFGKLDGLGALGGLAERTSDEEFNALDEAERLKLVEQKDDVILQSGRPVLTKNIDVIRQKNVLREMREELDDLGIQGIAIDPSKLELVPMPKVKDDNFLINIWGGTGPCFAITPYCHLYKDSEGLMDKIIANTKEKEGGEATSYQKIPLFNALGAYGNKGSQDCQLEDGRSAVKDYRYPHEYLAVWALAAKLLNYDPQKMVALSEEVQSSVNHRISFVKLAETTGQTLSDLAHVLKLDSETLEQMEKTTWNCFNKKGNTIALLAGKGCHD